MPTDVLDNPPVTRARQDVGKKKAYKHKEKPLFLRLPPAYHEALSALARKARRTLTAEAMIALEEYFSKNGLDIPSPDAPSEDSE